MCTMWHNFINPDDGEVHTQKIENIWMHAKRKLKRQFGTTRSLFPSYLHEFLLGNMFRNDDFSKTSLYVWPIITFNNDLHSKFFVE